MIKNCDIRISAGGRLTGFKGWMPRVLEEIAIAVEFSKPIFLIGGFGGVSRSACRLITEKVVPEELTFEWQLNNNLELREMMKFASSRGVDYEPMYNHMLDIVMDAGLQNGLSQEDNVKLFESPFADEVIHLILKGMSQL